MSSVGNHKVNGGSTIIDCTTCHNPHVSEQSTDPRTDITADNVSLVRSTIAQSRVPGVQNPVVYQQPSQFIFTEAPYSGVCQSCHTSTNHYRNDGSVDVAHQAGTDCLICHTHGAGFAGSLDHVAAGAVLPLPGCMNCHGDGGQDPVVSVHNADCGLCHVNTNGGGPMIEPYETIAPSGGDCTACHGTMAQSHQGANHTGTPGSGYVVIFADDDHDDAGWIGPRPYFDILVDCDLCHTTDLTAAHGQRCETCHPAPFDSLGTWSGGCEAGACHQTIHEGSIPAHWPFGDTFDPGNDCNRCHERSTWTVEQTSCLYCHDTTYGPGDVTPPVTTSDVLVTYTGPARIDFVVKDEGQVGVGTTFYRLDGGATLAGSNALVNAPGLHTLEFWSMDQAGNLEAPSTEVTFTIIEDTTPPTTTSNAYSSYYHGATITLTATDTSSLGVKTTYYSLNGGPIRTGATVSVAPVSGVISYELLFWSEDWSGNVEAPKSASFTVTSGTVTLRLVWGDSDTGSPPSNPDDWADWYIRRGGPTGYLVASGSGSNPGWSGVDDVVVPVSPTPYYVDIWWWDSYWGWDDNTVFPSVLADTPGEIIRLSY
jgi:hypothetical protein